MSYETAISTAKRYTKIIQFFVDNRQYFNDKSELTMQVALSQFTDVTVKKDVLGIYDDKVVNSLYNEEIDPQYDSEYQFIAFVPTQDIEVSTNKYFNGDIHKYNDYKGCSTEEGYFQFSTVYSEKILDYLVVLDYFNQKGLPSFYLDYEYINLIEDFINEKSPEFL